jgi:competence protein ComEA
MHLGFRSSTELACVIVFTLAGPVLAQSALPEGEGRELTINVCGQCHAADVVASVRLTRDGWRDTIANMAQLGAKATDKELETILEYLATHFKGEAARALNLNVATNVELESVASLLRKEAAALIAYREKRGPCKTLEDLKKVPGLDYKKIEARKDRLVCM